MAQPQQQCDNCLKLFPESKIATHFGYCRRNIKKCADCGEMYDINNREQHEQEFHKKAACRYCKNQMPVADLKGHEQSCSKKTEYCEYCELNVPSNQYRHHLKACQSRTKKCDKCSKAISNKDYLIHIATCSDKFNETQSTEQFSINHYARLGKDKIPQKNPKNPYNYQNNKEADFRKKPEDGASNRHRTNMIPKQSEDLMTKNSKSSKDNVPGSLGTGPTKSTTSQPRREIFNPTGIKKQEQQSSQRGIYKPQITNIEERCQQIPRVEFKAGGIKRQIRETKKELPTYKNVMPPTYNANKNQQKYSGSASYQNRQGSSRKREKIFDAKQYRGTQSKQIPQEIIEDSFNYKNHHKLQQFDEEEQIQKAIMQSLQQSKKSPSLNFQNIPKQLQSQDLMRASWSRDFDIEKQRAIQQDLKRNAKRTYKR